MKKQTKLTNTFSWTKEKKKENELCFTRKKLSWQNFFHSVSRFHRQRRKLGNFFILRKIFYSCKQVQNFLKTFFHTWKINFPRRKKVLLKYTVFTQFQTWKKFLNFIFFKPSECFRRTFFSFLKLRKKKFSGFFPFLCVKSSGMFFLGQFLKCLKLNILKLSKKSFFQENFQELFVFNFSEFSSKVKIYFWQDKKVP